jgi:hypothetical protein
MPDKDELTGILCFYATGHDLPAATRPVEAILSNHETSVRVRDRQTAKMLIERLTGLGLIAESPDLAF